MRVNFSWGESENHTVESVAYPVDCRTDGGVCDPLWTGSLGTGMEVTPGVVAGNSVFEQVGDRITGFRADCARDDSECRPSFEWSTSGNYTVLRSSGDWLVDGSEDGTLTAWDARCEAPCAPLWG